MQILFYNIFSFLIFGGIRLASLWNPKAKLWVKGRKNMFDELEMWRAEIAGSEKIIWMHCASLGEFEQGRPVTEAIKRKYPAHRILITFYSPSGYEVRKNYEGADGVFYLPADSRMNAKRFVEIVKPSLVIWIKYEYWFHMLKELHRSGIPILLISARFRSSQPFFKFYGGIWRKMLGFFSMIFVQDEKSQSLLARLNKKIEVQNAGDTRFDRVIAIAESGEALPKLITDFAEDSKIIVAGSTWTEDEEVIVHYVKTHPGIKFIIAPHEIDRGRLDDIKALFPRSCFLSTLQPGEKPQVLIIDNIGMLSRLYQCADICYVGGGFTDSGIHNILEAAVFGKPIIFGPNYEKFGEAIDLVECKAAFSVRNALEPEALLNKLLDRPIIIQMSGERAKNYVYSKKGATAKVVDFIQANRLLTN